jgi:hypothetical protein
MLKLPRTLRLDPSDGVVFDRAAAPGEWAVPGGFSFWDEDPERMPGKRRQAFRSGWLGLGSFGFSTLVEVAGLLSDALQATEDALADHILREHGAPDLAAARAAAAEELRFAAELCRDHPAGTVLALSRRLEGGELREEFRTLHLRDRAPVFAIVEDDSPAEAVDLRSLPHG